MNIGRTSFMLIVAGAAPAWAETAGNLIRTNIPQAPPSSQSSAFDTFRVIGVLLLVLAAIWACRWIMQRMARLHPGGVNTSIRVLSRTAISPRQRILAIQVAQRVLIVADSGQQLTTLCQITDPKEVALLTGQTSAGEKDDFAEVLRREMSLQTSAEEPADAADDLPEMAADAEASLPGQEVRSLLEKVRGLSRQFR